MTSLADGAGRSTLVLEMQQRIQAIEGLAETVADALRRGDAVTIEESTSRLETLLVEYRVLAEELRRLMDQRPETDPADTRQLRMLEATATRVARSGAIAAGVVGRMALINRRLTEALGRDGDSTYGSDGHSREGAVQGLRLQERV